MKKKVPIPKKTKPIKVTIALNEREVQALRDFDVNIENKEELTKKGLGSVAHAQLELYRIFKRLKEKVKALC